MTAPDLYPLCGADLTGEPIPEEDRRVMGWLWYAFCELFGHDIARQSPPRNGQDGWVWCRRCQRKIITVKSSLPYRCPDCNGTWPVDGQQK